MRSSRQMSGIIPYVLSVLLFPLKCNSAVHTIQKWGDDRFEIFYFTTRSPWSRFTIGDYNRDPNKYKSDDAGAIVIPLVIIMTLIGVLGLFLYFVIKCIQKAQSSSSNNLRSGIVHPPPSRNSIYEPPGMTPLPPVLSHYNINAPAAVRPEFTLNFSGMENAYQPLWNASADTTTTDKPPDYAAVVINDLSGKKNLQSKFPTVTPKREKETPPPKYDGFNFVKPNEFI